jgi:pantothenate kinase-related protein Tda10
MKKMAVCLTVWMVTLAFTLSVNGQAQVSGKQTEQTPVVIFVCEHGAAKSILSAALFNKLAQE